MSRLIAFVYGLGATRFSSSPSSTPSASSRTFPCPSTIDTGLRAPITEALIVNMLLMSLFAIQHSVMARPQFKAWWTQYRAEAGRAQHLCAVCDARAGAAVLAVAADPGRRLAGRQSLGAAMLTGLSLLGWLIVLTSTFLINHFELFGVHQVVNNLTGRTMPAPRFRTPLLYKFVRHPIYLGFIIAFWAAPAMTAGHLLFAAVTTAYIFVGIAAGGARPDRRVRRRLPPLPSARVDDRALAPVGLTSPQIAITTIAIRTSCPDRTINQPSWCHDRFRHFLGAGAEELRDRLALLAWLGPAVDKIDRGARSHLSGDRSRHLRLWRQSRARFDLPLTLADEVAHSRRCHRSMRTDPSISSAIPMAARSPSNGDGLAASRAACAA